MGRNNSRGWRPRKKMHHAAQLCLNVCVSVCLCVCECECVCVCV